MPTPIISALFLPNDSAPKPQPKEEKKTEAAPAKTSSPDQKKALKELAEVEAKIDTLEKELAGYPILWLNESLSQVALSLYRQNHLNHGVHFMDCVIASTALAKGLTLCTSVGHIFGAFNGLTIERPY